jgi:hypothetical protein
MRLREARENAEMARVTERVRFDLGDIMNAQIGEATVVTLYLLDEVNLRLRPLLFQQLRPGTRVVAHAFRMGDWDPDEIIRHPRARNNLIYVWTIPGSAGGRWNWISPYGQDELRFSMVIEQEFQFLSATLSAGTGTAIPVKKAVLRGNDIAIEAELPAGSSQARMSYTGTINGDTILGAQTWTTGTNVKTLEWLAHRDPVDPAGTWEIAVAPRPVSFSGGSLAVSRNPDGSLSAEFSKAGHTKHLRHFYRWGACVRFDVPISESSSASYTAIVEGNTMRGQAVWPESSTLDWTASRTSQRQSVATGGRR